jgi:hypothetical protein
VSEVTYKKREWKEINPDNINFKWDRSTYDLIKDYESGDAHIYTMPTVEQRLNSLEKLLAEMLDAKFTAEETLQMLKLGRVYEHITIE